MIAANPHYDRRPPEIKRISVKRWHVQAFAETQRRTAPQSPRLSSYR